MHTVLCPICNWTGKRVRANRACPNCGYWKPITVPVNSPTVRQRCANPKRKRS